MNILDQLRKEHAGILERMAGLVESAEPGPDTDKNLAELETAAKSIHSRIEQIVKVDETRAAMDSLDARSARAGSTSLESRGSAPTDVASLFIESRAYAEFRSGASRTSTVDVPCSPLEFRAPVNTTDLPGLALMPQPQRLLAAEPTDLRPLTQLVSKVQVNSNVIDWVTYGTPPAAGVVAEGAPKPEGALTATITPYSLDTIAHWVQATRQVMEDSDSVRSFIDGQLRRGVLDRIESNIAAAITAATLPTATGASLLEAIRIGIGTVEAEGFSPNGIVLNPADYAALDIAVMGGTLLGPTVRPSYWGLPVISSSLQAAGTALVGDFTAGVTLLQRTGVSVYVTDSHASTFTSNIFTLLAEARARTVVGRTDALVECSEAP